MATKKRESDKPPKPASCPPYPRAELVRAIHTLASLATRDLNGDLTDEERRALDKVMGLLDTHRKRSRSRLEMETSLGLVAELANIYADVTFRAHQPPRELPTPGSPCGRWDATPETFDVFRAVEDAVDDWARATGNVNHEATTQRRKEELELDADEIRRLGGPVEAAIKRVEHVLGIPHRTTHHRRGRHSRSPEAQTESEIWDEIARVRGVRRLQRELLLEAGGSCDSQALGSETTCDGLPGVGALE